MRSRVAAIAVAIRDDLEAIASLFILAALVWVLLNIDTTQAWLWRTP